VRYRFASALIVLAAACGGAQKSAPEPVAVDIPSALDAGTSKLVAEPVADASVAPVASAAPEEPEGPKRERKRGNSGVFDRAAVAEALSEIDTSICATPGGPRGRGHIQITFHPSGNVQSLHLEQPFYNTSSGACVMSLYQSVSIPSFNGSPVTVGKMFVVP